jgi:hypothetical protein
MPIAALLWTLGSFVAFFVAFAASILATATVLAALAPESYTLAPGIVVWSLASAAAVVLLARLLFWTWPRLSATAIGTVVIGALLAGGLELTLRAWAIDRFGQFDDDLIGPTTWLFVIVCGQTVAAFAAMVAPRGAETPPLVLAAIGAALIAATVALNLPGLADGIAPESAGLAVAVGLSAVYAVATLALGWRRARVLRRPVRRS